VVAHEPHKIKTVRLLSFPTIQERKKHLAEAGFNTFHLTPRQVTFDMCSYGTGAMSQEQISGQFIGDEAYAGSRNFETLQKAVEEIFGHSYLCPTHNILGSVKLVVSTMVPDEAEVPTNSRGIADNLTPRGVEAPSLRDEDQEVFTGNLNLGELERVLEGDSVPIIMLQAFADGYHPFSLENLREVRRLADAAGARLVLDGSRVVENAWYIQKHECGLADRSIAFIVKQMAKTAHVFMFDGALDAKANAGGLLTTDNPEDHEKFMNEVVVFEGLHTYGGMAGRTMEVLARGMMEMVDEKEAHWVMDQNERFTQRLKDAGVPLERGCDGAYLQADAFLPHLEKARQATLAAALYLVSGVRTVAPGLVGRDALLPVQVPRLTMTNDQLEQVADAIIHLYSQADRVNGLQVTSEGIWRDQMSYHWVLPNLDLFEFDSFPFHIHTTERVGVLSREDREKAMREAGYNTFLLRSAEVAIDLLTDSGTTAMSTDQWAAYEGARASAVTSEEYFDFVAALQDAFGYEYIIPTHQGRAAEHILSQTQVQPGQLVPGNMYFTTTKLHQEMAGGIFADVIVDEAHDPTSDFQWKGNIDLEKLDGLVQEHGAAKIAYISFEHSVNMETGWPPAMFTECSKEM